MSRFPLLTPLVGILLANGLSAQTVLSENFDVWPPSGWTVVNNNGAPSQGWIHDALQGRAWHEDEPGYTSDDTLVSPVMDFSSLSSPRLHFDGETNWAAWLANHPISSGDGVSTMEITLNGGRTWTMVWIDTSLNDHDTYSPVVDLSQFAGMPQVQLGIHYYGTYAQEWWVDNVVVDSAITTPTISSFNLVAGSTGQINCTRFTPGGLVYLVYSLAGGGPTSTPWGNAGVSFPYTLLPPQVGDPSGNAVFVSPIPPRGAGIPVWFQGLDLASGTLSNALAETIQ